MTPKYSLVNMEKSETNTVRELTEFFEVNRENLKYSKRGYRERLRQAFIEQSGINVSDSQFRSVLSKFRQIHNCPLEISTPQYKSVKERRAVSTQTSENAQN